MALHDHSNNPLWQSSIKLFLFTMSYNVSQTILYIEYETTPAANIPKHDHKIIFFLIFIDISFLSEISHPNI